MMYGMEDSPTLRFATAASKLGCGLDEQIEGFIRGYPEPSSSSWIPFKKSGRWAVRLTAMPPTMRSSAGSSSLPTSTGSASWQSTTPENRRLLTSSIPNGIAGSVDGTLVMEKPVKTGLEATIHVTGRDHQDQILYLKKDPVTQIWNLERLENELHIEPPDPVLEVVAKLVSAEQAEWTGSPSELAEIIHSDMAVNSLSKYLNIRCGKLLEDYNIRYENKAKALRAQDHPDLHAPAGRSVKQGATVATVATVIQILSQQPSQSLLPLRKGKEANEKCANFL